MTIIPEDLNPLEYKRRIDAALTIIMSYGGVDGGWHKQWVLDQVVRELAGPEYERWVTFYEAGEDGPKTYEWSKGTRHDLENG